MFKNLTTQFLRLKDAQGIAKRTMTDYKKTLDSFFAAQVTKDNLRDRLLDFFTSKSKLSPSSFNVPYAYLNSFFNWCVKENHLPDNPIKSLGLKKRKEDIDNVRHVGEDDIKKFVDVIRLNTMAGLRDYTLIALTLDTGIRPSEALALSPADLDLDNSRVNIRKEISKTRISRTLPLSYQTVEIFIRLMKYLEPNSKFLFITEYGQQMGIDRWEKRLQKYSSKSGVRITPYMLRHSFAIMYLKNGGNVFSLQKELGHTDLTMTRRYIRLVESDLKEIHKTASPINNIIKRTTKIKRIIG